MMQNINSTSTYWVCIQPGKNKRSKDMVRMDTLDLTRKESIGKLLKGSHNTWEDCQGWGWTCEKVTLTIQKK